MPVDSSPSKLPVIKFSSDMKEDKARWESARSQVVDALNKFGCFEAVYEDVSPTLAKATIDAIKDLYDLPVDVKSRYRSDELFVGYNGNNPKMPFFEGLGVPDVVSGEALGRLTNLMWPEGNPNFSDNVRLFCSHLSELDKIVRTMLFENWGLEKYLDDHIGSTRYVARIQKYNSAKRYPNCTDENALPTHTDKNYVTLLHQNDVNGLDVQTRDGQWITYDPSSVNSFAVMTGDCFSAITNGRLPPCAHKVAAVDRDRYMIAVGSSPKPDYEIRVAPEMVDEEHPLKYKPFKYGEFLKFYGNSSPSKDGNLPDTLKEYCGA